MRLIPLALVAIMAVACGGDEAEEQPSTPPRPTAAPERQAPADTTLGDTTAAAAAAEARRQRQAAAEGTSGAAAGQAASPTGRPTSGSDAAASTGARLYTVQVGAFTDAGTATEWERRLRSQGLPVWTSMAEIGGRTFYRLRVGAVSSVSEARRLGGMLGARYEWPVWVAPVTSADRLPQGAIERTRQALEGG